MRNISTILSRSARPKSPMYLLTHCEPLENRQMLSLTVDVRATDGSKIVDVSSVGQVVTLGIWATVTGKNGNPTQDTLQDVFGSFLSSETGPASIDGNLAAVNLPVFTANGSQPGDIQDLNGDGNLDVGSNSVNTPRNEYFDARSGSPTGSTSGNAIVVGGSVEFEIGLLKYTVTSLNQGGETDISFRPEPVSITLGAVWSEDNTGKNGQTGIYQAGAPLVLTDPAIAAAPVAVSATVDALKSTPTRINELAFDTSVDSLNPSGILISNTTSHGSIAIQSDGSIFYTPVTGFLGTDSFTYTVADINGAVSNPATITIDVVSTAPPAAGNVADSVILNGSVDVKVLSSDSAASGLTLISSSVNVVKAPIDGTAIVQKDGSILFTPNHGFLGSDTFYYTVSDSIGDVSNIASVSLNVVSTPPPVAGNVSFIAEADKANDINVLSHDTAAPGLTIDPASVRIVFAPTHGSAVVQSDGSILYTPTAGYTGGDLIQYAVRDSNGVESDGNDINSNITIDVVSGPPTAANVQATTTVDKAVDVNVLATATAAPGATLDTLHVFAASPMHGSVIDEPDGTILYTPSTGYSGPDSFTYTVLDTDGELSAPATVTVTVLPGPPVAGNDSVNLVMNQATIVKVLGNDSAGNGASLVPGTVSIVANPAHGTALPQTNGTILYTPTNGYAGADAFTYTVEDSVGSTSNVATVSLVISKQLAGTIIGTAGSYRDHGTTIANAFDNNLSTYFDAPSANGDWVGLDLGTKYSITQINFAPRTGFAGRMIGGVFQGSNDPTFTTGMVPLATITTAPVTGVFTTVTLSNPSAFRYVRYLSPTGGYGNVAEIQFFGLPATQTTTQLTGTVFGTPGSYQNDGNTIANVFDGSLSTFFDSPTGNGNYVGLDLGTAHTITQISYAPRAGWAQRMVGGIFQASNSADFSTGVVLGSLYQITTAPTSQCTHHRVGKCHRQLSLRPLPRPRRQLRQRRGN